MRLLNPIKISFSVAALNFLTLCKATTIPSTYTITFSPSYVADTCTHCLSGNSYLEFISVHLPALILKPILPEGPTPKKNPLFPNSVCCTIGAQLKGYAPKATHEFIENCSNSTTLLAGTVTLEVYPSKANAVPETPFFQ